MAVYAACRLSAVRSLRLQYACCQKPKPTLQRESTPYRNSFFMKTFGSLGLSSATKFDACRCWKMIGFNARRVSSRYQGVPAPALLSKFDCDSVTLSLFSTG